MAAPLREQQVYHYTRSFPLEENITYLQLSILKTLMQSQDRVIDDNLKRQIKNRTLGTIRLFLPT